MKVRFLECVCIIVKEAGKQSGEHSKGSWNLKANSVNHTMEKYETLFGLAGTILR